MNVTFLTDEDKVLRYDEQDLTPEEKAQARENIGAVACASATDDFYFDITADGVISLKPEYRGSCPSSAANNEANRVKYGYAISDNDVNLPGTQNKELPEEIVIPEAVGGVAVTALAYAMFMCNKRIKRIVLPESITAIPAFCFFEAMNLTEVSGTEYVETLEGNAFKKTAIQKAYFPNLTTINGTSHFENCANLVTADLGHVFENHGATIPKACFSMCEKLVSLKNAGGVTTINERGLYATYRLTNLPFLPYLTTVQKNGLLLSRADYDWDNSLVSTFGVLATSKQVNNYTYTESNNVCVACCNPMRSMFDQHDPRWADKNIGNTDDNYATGCMTVCAAMVYSALKGVDMESPEEFVAAVGKENSALLNLDIDDPGMGFSGLVQWLGAVGMQGTTYSSPSDNNIKAMYTALAGGALVIARVLGDNSGTNHVVVFRGINSNGELLVVNPSSFGRVIGLHDAISYAMPVQNMMRDATGAANTGETIEDGFVIVTNK